MLAPFLAALWTAYHGPNIVATLALFLLALYGVLYSSPWWSLLVQSLLGIATGLAFSERWRTLRVLPAGGVTAVDAIDLFDSIVAALVFGYLYEHTRPLDDDIPVPWFGAPTAMALLLACEALSFLAKRFWLRLNERRDVVALLWMIEFSCLTLALDMLVWGQNTATRVGIAVVVGVRYLTLIVTAIVSREAHYRESVLIKKQ
jgi:hypothetical protein